MNFRRLIILLIALIPLGSKAQDLNTLIDKITGQHTDRPIEKQHLHLDKLSYTTGETIWFKAYTSIGTENLLSNLSKIGYVELIDPTSKVVSSTRILLSAGLGIGDITLQDSLLEGSYRLRAYTNWMRNADPQFFFEQNINISNGRTDNVLTDTKLSKEALTIQLKSFSGIALTKKTVRYEFIKNEKSIGRGKETTTVDGSISIPMKAEFSQAKLRLNFENLEKIGISKVLKVPELAGSNATQFFPEGGNLLVGTLNNLAVKALKPDGLGIAAQITITNTQQDTLASFATNALGMGKTTVFINDESALQAHITYKDGTKESRDLPKVMASGMNMQVNSTSSSKIYAQINTSEDKLDNSDLYFLIQSNGSVYFVSKQKLSKTELVFSVPKAGLPSGVLTISILNAQLQPILERPIFIMGMPTMPLAVQTDASSYGLRKQVKVALQAGDAADSTKLAALSASVINLSKITDSLQYAPNIYSSLFLSADVKGYIENPGYYFDQTVKLEEIDYLLLTQGWRKLDWDSVNTVNKPKFAAEQGISVKGQARKLGRKAPVPLAKINLVSTQNFMDFIDTTATAEGNFEFDKLIFPDSVKFLVTAKDEKGKNNIDIIIAPDPQADLGVNRNAASEKNDINSLFREELSDSKQYFAALENQGLMEKTIALDEVVVTARKTKKAAENSANLNGSGNADQILTAEDLSTCASLEMCLAGRLMGVTFLAGVPYNTRGNVPMQVVMDGMYIESDQLSMINPSDIASVEVLRNSNYTTIYGSYGANGLIVITSKTGRDALSNYIPKGIITVQPKGIPLGKVFYKPIYEVDSKAILNKDLRTTLHWEPNIVTDQDGKAAFDFYTSDEAGTYGIIIEGIDFNGRLIHKLLEFEVK